MNFHSQRKRHGHDHLWVAVASGKGGTGKTSVAISLAKAFLDAGNRVQLIDADVEGPNAHHFLDMGEGQETIVNSMLPVIDKNLCTHCGVCIEACAFHALADVHEGIMVFPELCHGCEACMELCPQKIISAGHQEIGRLRHWAKERFDVWQGRLHVGQVLTPSLIRDLFQQADSWNGDITIVDAPPGTACPMVAATRTSDHLLLVTEPTPFGRHDLELAMKVANLLHLPCEVIINRSDGKDEIIDELCRARGIPVLERFPNDRAVAEAYARGQVMGTLGGKWGLGFHHLRHHLEAVR